MYILYHSPNRSDSLATSTKKALVGVTKNATTTRAYSQPKEVFSLFNEILL